MVGAAGRTEKVVWRKCVGRMSEVVWQSGETIRLCWKVMRSSEEIAPWYFLKMMMLEVGFAHLPWPVTPLLGGEAVGARA